MKKKMLIVCDVEGTIFQAKYKIEGTDYASSMWQPIAHALGEKAEREEYETHLRWDNSEYDNYVDWVKATVEIHRKYKLKREVFNRIIDEAEYMPGVEAFFQKIDREKFIPVLITGGFRNLTRRAEKELKIDSSNIFAACNYNFDTFGNLTDVDIQSSDFEDKISCVKTVISKYALDFNDDWIFIGDGKNDVPIAQLAPYSFAINGHPKLNNVVSSKITNYMEAYDQINDWYDMVNADSNTKDYRKKVLERAALRQVQREKIVNANIELYTQVEELKKRIEVLENTIPQPTKVEAVIPFAEYYYGENIIFSKEAKKSLIENAEAGYTKKYIEGIFEQLAYINLWAKKKKGLISDDEYKSKVSTRKIAYALSESTENMLKKDYMDNGVLINMHIYMSSLPNCSRPRTYFGWDEKHNKALVSTMCEHKRTSKYK